MDHNYNYMKTYNIHARIAHLNKLLIGFDSGSTTAAAATDEAAASPSSSSTAAAYQSSSDAAVSPPQISISTSKVLEGALHRENLLDVLKFVYSELPELYKITGKPSNKYMFDFVKKYDRVIKEIDSIRINPNDFELKTMIGKGYFGEVYLVCEKMSNDIYAMKKINKSEIMDTNSIKAERDIMVACNHSPWITKLEYAFQDIDYLYLVMEYLPGGDLLGLLLRNGAFSEDVIRFYLAELTLAIKDMHSLGFVHRDIKPENILLNRFGHIKLADLGNAAQLSKNGTVQLMKPVGTPDYIAPELLQQIDPSRVPTVSNTDIHTHGVQCDYWSMGIIGYELLTETTPFHDECIAKTYTKILSYCGERQEKLSYPIETDVSAEFRNLIDGLINNSKTRFTHSQVMRHKFFQRVNWDTISEIVPPFIPKLSSDTDTSNFEDVNNGIQRRGQQQRKNINNAPMCRFKKFSGFDLQFLGYAYVRENRYEPILFNERLSTRKSRENHIDLLKKDLNEAKLAHMKQTTEIEELQKKLLTAEKTSTQTKVLEKILGDAKNELDKMKEQLKTKTIALAESHTNVKTLQGSLKLVEEMRLKSDENISELLNSTYQKWERAKKASDQNYEKHIAEKRTELLSIKNALEVREQELSTKADKCKHLQDTIDKYKEMLKMAKDQHQNDKEQYVEHKEKLVEMYKLENKQTVMKLTEQQKCVNALNEKFRDLENQLDKSTASNRNLLETCSAINQNLDDIKDRYDLLLEENRELRKANYDKAEETMKQRRVDELKLRKSRFTEPAALFVAPARVFTSNVICGVNNNNQSNNGSTTSERRLSDELSLAQFKSCRASLESLNSTVEEQLRNDLIMAREHESMQRQRADRLEHTVQRLEDAIEKLNSTPKRQDYEKPEKQYLEKKNERLEHQLDSVKEQAIVERQASRTAHLSLYKLEKQIEDLDNDKKLHSYRLQQLQDTIKSHQSETLELNSKLKEQKLIEQHKDDKIDELTVANRMLTDDLKKQYDTWKKSEEERVQKKSEIIENVYRINAYAEKQRELNDQLKMIKLKNNRLTDELKCALADGQSSESDLAECIQKYNELQTKYDQFEKNYSTLKEACTLTEQQFTEFELMYEKQMERNEKQSQEIDQLWKNVHDRDRQITKLQQQLTVEESDKIACESKLLELKNELIEFKFKLEQREQKLYDQNQLIIKNTNEHFKLQETFDVQQMENQTIKNTLENQLSEINILKEENTNLLTQLYLDKEALNRIHSDLEQCQQQNAEMTNTIEKLNNLLHDQKQFYLHRDIKSEATQQQLKKLVNYLQQRVDELSQRKKKTLVDVLFGIRPAVVTPTTTPIKKSSNTLPASTTNRYQEELIREKLRTNKLKNDLLKTKTEIHNLQKRSSAPVNGVTVIDDDQVQQQHNSNEVSEEQSNWLDDHLKSIGNDKCIENINSIGNIMASNGENVSKDPINSIDNQFNLLGNYTERILFKTNDFTPSIELYSIYQIFENILLLGTDSGLYSFHLDTQQLILINGLTSCNWIAANRKLQKSILIGSMGEHLYQCDYRHLESRAQADLCLKPKLDCIQLDLSAIVHHLNDRWHSIELHDKNRQMDEPIAIAAATSKIVILKYERNVFYPIQALDTAIPVRSIYFSQHTAIVASNRFFEMDLEYFSVEEFLDMSDESVTHARNCKPMAVFPINQSEYLLCFNEFGMYVDEYGCRSRPANLKWSSGTSPIEFAYREPFLYCFYQQFIQIIKIYKVFSNELLQNNNLNPIDFDDDQRLTNDTMNRKCIIKLMNPKLFGNFGYSGILIGTKTSTTTKHQEIIIIDGHTLNLSSSHSSLTSSIIPSESDV